MSRIRDIANILSGVSTDMATDAEVTSSIASHAAAADPHSVYLKESEFNAAGKNIVINGGMDVWQRGTSFASSNSTYVFTADRWEIVRHGYLLGMTVTRQTAGLDGFRYCARIQRDSGNTSTNNLQFQTSFETSEVLPFINKTMTISFYARKSSTASANSLNAQIIAGTGTDQAMKNYTGGTIAFQQTFTLTDSWQRFSFSGSVLSPYTEFGIWFGYTPSGTAGAADYVELTGVQIEQGSVATSFTRAAGNIQGEISACQRYYIRFGNDQNYTFIGSGNADSSTKANIAVPLPVTMRVAPTSIEYSTLFLQNNGGSAILSVTSLTFSPAAVQGKNMGVAYPTVAAGLTQGTNYVLGANGTTNGYLGFSAEL